MTTKPLVLIERQTRCRQRQKGMDAPRRASRRRASATDLGCTRGAWSGTCGSLHTNEHRCSWRCTLHVLASMRLRAKRRARRAVARRKPARRVRCAWWPCWPAYPPQATIAKSCPPGSTRVLDFRPRSSSRLARCCSRRGRGERLPSSHRSPKRRGASSSSCCGAGAAARTSCPSIQSRRRSSSAWRRPRRR